MRKQFTKLLAVFILILLSALTAKATPYYSRGNLDPTVVTNWNSNRDGSNGTTPGNFTTTGDAFIIQGTGNGGTTPHSMINTTAWSIGSGVTLEIENGAILTASSSGTNAALITFNSGSTFQIDGGGTYNHNCLGAFTSLFGGTESFASTSNFNVNPGAAMTGPSTATCSSNFGNFSYLSTGTMQCNGLLPNIAGTLTINATGELRLASSAGGGNLTISGDLVITTGTFSYGTGTSIPTINLGGNFRMTGGVFQTAITGGTVSVPTIAAFNFSKPGVQTFTKTGGTITAASSSFRHIAMNVLSGATLDMGTSILNCAGSTNLDFTVNSGGTVRLGDPAGIVLQGTTATTGNIQTSSTSVRSFNTGGNYEYTGSTTQATGSGLPSSVNNLNVNNSAGITLSTAITVNGTITLTSGTLNNSTNNITFGNGATVILTGGSLSAVPNFGTSVNLTYNGSSTKGNEFPSTDIINTLTVNNTGGIVLSDNRSISNLSLFTGSSLTINAGKQLTVSTSFTNNSTLNLLSDASGTATILTPTTISGSGTATVQQYLTAGRNWYISSPVSGATSNVFNAASSSTNKLYSYDEVNGSTTSNWPQIIDNTTSLNVGKGYVANVDASLLAASNGVTFTGGTFNTGDITTGVTSGVPALTSTPEAGGYQGYNLIGNPYPSYLNAMTAINNAGNTVIDPTVWYRTQSKETIPTYYFETVNTTSGAGTDNAGTGTVTGFIPPMQAFWVHVATGASSPSLTFSNNMRSHSKSAVETGTVATTSMKAPSAKNAVQQLLRLRVSNGTNGDEAIVYFNPDASNGLDNYDSRKRSNNDPAIPEIYTAIGSEKLAINGMNSISTGTEIPLGFTTGQSNAFSIKATEFSNFNASTKVYLKDKLTGTEQDLTDGTTYAFASDATVTSNRFSIVFKAAGVTTENNTPTSDAAALIYKNASNQITVVCKGELKSDAIISVYNTLGKKLDTKKITSTTTVINTPFASGVYVVTVNNGGKSTIQKVILN